MYVIISFNCRQSSIYIWTLWRLDVYHILNSKRCFDVMFTINIDDKHCVYVMLFFIYMVNVAQ